MIRRVGVIYFVLLGALLSPSSSIGANDIEHVVGFGLGLPYGGFGLNYELGITDYFAPTAGFGYLYHNVQWNVGARLYYPGRSAEFRFRSSVLYGTNTIIETRYTYKESEYETDEGVSVGIGCDWRFGRNWGFDADVFYADIDVPEGYTRENDSDILVALGFSRRW